MSTALVTGATAGIGYAFATHLARQGHDLVIVARDRDRLETVAEELRILGRIDVEVLVADLADRGSLAAVEARLADAQRPVGILVNNAGFGIREDFVAADVEDEQRMIDVMVTAVMRLTHAVLPSMIRYGSGAVLNVSSVASWLPGGTYSAAKAWVTMFSESLSGQLAGTGVNVTAVCPGYTHTEFHQRAEMDMSQVPDWMWLDVEQVVDAALSDVRRGRAVSVAGRQYKVLSQVMRHAPRRLLTNVAGRRKR